MLTPEQLEELRWQLHYARPLSSVLAVSIKSIDGLFAHIDAQQVRIAELEKKLSRIERLAECETIKNYLSMPDEDKAVIFTFGLARDKEQIARINELESNAEAHALAMKAGKAMLAAETARADAAEQDAARYRWLRDPDQCESPGDYLNIAFEQMDAAIDADMKGTE